MSKIAFFVLALLALPSFAGMEIVEFTSQPAGAAVVVNGERRGTTPLQLTDLRAGVAHHVRFELKNYVSVDDFLTLEPDAAVRKDVALEPVKGLLLLTSDPEGAEVTQNGYSLGQTPRLITTLNAKDFHTLLLRKPGYQDGKLAVRFDGRRPLVQNVKLVLDSGVIDVRTDPEGAEVTVNGIACGTSPTTARDVNKGRVVVEVKKPGYRSATRELAVGAGDTQQVFVKLEPIPGTLRLTSIPSGARFYLDDTPLFGGTPCVKEGLAPGTYRIRAELKGYATQERTVTLAHGQDLSEEFRLENVMGAFEFKTTPPGATVMIDGKRVGTSSSADPAADTSDVLVIRNQLAGDHEIRVEKAGYAPWSGHLTARASETVQKAIRLKKVFTPDLRVTLFSGEVIEGVRVSEDATSLILEVRLGMTRPIPQELIRKREALFAQ